MILEGLRDWLGAGIAFIKLICIPLGLITGFWRIGFRKKKPLNEASSEESLDDTVVVVKIPHSGSESVESVSITFVPKVVCNQTDSRHGRVNSQIDE